MNIEEWTKLAGNPSYEPPGASYTATGPYILQGNEKMRATFFYKNSKCSLYIPIYSLQRDYVVYLQGRIVHT